MCVCINYLISLFQSKVNSKHLQYLFHGMEEHSLRPSGGSRRYVATTQSSGCLSAF